uniref:Kyphoscoliosis peptidase n=1 Tax=Hippocampus comes TaxID=109280 RepID=A0A3Q2Z0S3_HIPCM
AEEPQSQGGGGAEGGGGDDGGKAEEEERSLCQFRHLPPMKKVCLKGTHKKKNQSPKLSGMRSNPGTNPLLLMFALQLREKRVHDVAAIVQNIASVAKSELEKIRAIWVWLCHNIEYDIGGYLGQSEKLCSPEEVIATGRGVCCGYSGLCMQMCRLVGVECQEVAGHSKGIGYRQGQSLRNVKSDHLWNAVLLGGQWFLMDACWGAGRVDMEHQSFVKRFDDFYFLTDPEEFIDSHFPDEERWQLLEAPVTLEEFENDLRSHGSERRERPRPFPKTPGNSSLLGQKIASGLLALGFSSDEGEANISVGFSRPVTFTYEITPHQDFLHCGTPEHKEGSHSSFGLLTVSQHSMNLQLLPPASGAYNLRLYAKFQNAANFLLHCKGKVAGRDELFPPDLSSACGPGTRTAQAGLSKFSHTAALVSTPHGKCNITFHNRRDLELYTTLSRADETDASAFPLARHLFCTHTDSKVTVSVGLPDAGTYRLGVYARNGPGGEFHPTCDFVLRNGCRQAGLPFPCVYAAWRKGCVLFEPRAGLLDAASWVRFRVRIPGAQRVCVVAHGRTDLKLNKSRVWEGEVFSGEGVAVLKLAANSAESADMAVMMTFDVKKPS